MKIYSIEDKRFEKYGKVIKNYDLTGLIDALSKLDATDSVVYEPTEETLEKYNKMFADGFFGEMPIQIGYCNGKNYLLNAVEYHRSSEINIAAEDAILLLGNEWDIENDYTYDTSLIEAFRVPKGTAVELYATTLHYAPCSDGEKYFKMAVVLPKYTNYPLDKSYEGGEEKLLVAKNKFLIAHKDANIEGAFAGLKGKNIDVRE